MNHSQHSHISRHRRALRLRLATATALAVPLALIAPGTAHAKPVVSPPQGENTVLKPGTLIDLAPKATAIQVDESSGGGSVAVSWTVRNAAGRDELWARVKRGATWGSKVRISDPAASATRSTMDLDSDGSLMLAWAEQRGSAKSLVARRLSGSSLAARKVFKVAATDGPYVAAGPLHDVVAWTASSGGTVRPFASVDTGAGFPSGVAVSSAGWKHPVINNTLAVNADGQQVHITYLSKDTKAGKTRSSWSVLETTRGAAWAFWDGLGPSQKLAGPLRPMIAVDDRDIAALIFYNISEQDDVRYPGLFLYNPRTSGSARSRLADSRSLEAEDGVGVRTLVSVDNRRGSLFATYDTKKSGLPALLKRLTNPEESGFQPQDWNADSACTPYPHWLFTWQGDEAEIYCVDPDSSASGLGILVDYSPEPVSAISSDPAQPGSTLTAAVPDPLLSAIVITENLAGTTKDPVWLLDHTEGGRDAPPALLKLSRLKTPRIAGTPRVGKKLTAQIGSWKPSPSKVTYRWYAGKKVIKSATKRTLKLTKKMQGKKISVRLRLSRSGYVSKVVTAKRGQKIKAKN